MFWFIIVFIIIFYIINSARKPSIPKKHKDLQKKESEYLAKELFKNPNGSLKKPTELFKNPRAHTTKTATEQQNISATDNESLIERLVREKSEKLAHCNLENKLLENAESPPGKWSNGFKSTPPSVIDDLNTWNQEYLTELLAAGEREKVLANAFLDYGINSFWHMTHIDNISSIIRNGLVSHKSSRTTISSIIDISDPSIQILRGKNDPINNICIHDYVPLYINPKNPMLYKRKELQPEICFIEVSLSALFERKYLITDGNAASSRTKFYNSYDFLKKLPWNVLRSGSWADIEDGKRLICAEVLVYPEILPKHLKAVHCYSMKSVNTLKAQGINAVISKNKYFR